jgi:7-carboxy-7-deazaguanine synthase
LWSNPDLGRRASRSAYLKMAYSVKEIFYTLQGEGANTGTPAVFCRFAGCNLWSGREQDRNSAICRFCDTDFVGTNGPRGGRHSTPDSLADAVLKTWPQEGHRQKFVVLTGGEPALQIDGELIKALHARGFRIAVETNGTLPLPDGLDWICVSPKAGTKIVVRSGDELKLVVPQDNWSPEAFEEWNFTHFFLSPMDGPNRVENTKEAIAYCLAHPTWRLSLQTHKVLGIP